MRALQAKENKQEKAMTTPPTTALAEQQENETCLHCHRGRIKNGSCDVCARPSKPSPQPEPEPWAEEKTAELMKSVDEARARVSGYSPEKRAELEKAGRVAIAAADPLEACKAHFSRGGRVQSRSRQIKTDEPDWGWELDNAPEWDNAETMFRIHPYDLPEPAKAEWVPRVGDSVIWKYPGVSNSSSGTVVDLGQIAFGRVQVKWPDLALAIWELITNLEPLPKSTSWFLPPLPAGLAYHREDWTENMLKGGWRPLLKGEKLKFGDQMSSGPMHIFAYVSSHERTWTADEQKLHTRTLRLLPTPQTAAKTQSAGTAGEAAYKSYKAHDGSCNMWDVADGSCKLMWERIAKAAIAFHLAQPKPQEVAGVPTVEAVTTASPDHPR